MKPHEVIQALVDRTGKPVLQVAREMHSTRFQGTLHKYLSGNTTSPDRRTAERIATYFKIPVDAIYDARVARTVAIERRLNVHSPASYPMAHEPAPHYGAAPPDASGIIPAALLERIHRLAPEQRTALFALLRAHLDAVDAARPTATT